MLNLLLTFIFSTHVFAAQPKSCDVADKAKKDLAVDLSKIIHSLSGDDLYERYAPYLQVKAQVNACQIDAFNLCYPNLKPTIPKGELERLFREWRKFRLYKLADPSGLCYNRAYLLARELTERGYASHLVQMDPSPSIVSITSNDDGVPTHYVNYEKHWVVQVSVTDAAGTTKIMLLDPQFSLRPMIRDEYFVLVAGQVCINDVGNFPVKNAADCYYKVFHATHELYPPAPNVGPALGEKCGWSFTKPLTDEIEAALKVMPAAFRPLPIAFDALRTQYLHDVWQMRQDTIEADIKNRGAQMSAQELAQRRIDLQNIINRRAQLGF